VADAGYESEKIYRYLKKQTTPIHKISQFSKKEIEKTSVLV